MVLEIDGSYTADPIPAYPSVEERSGFPAALWNRLIEAWSRTAERHLIRVSDDNQRIENADILEISHWIDSYLANAKADAGKLEYLVFKLCLTCPFGVVLKPLSAWRFVLRFYPQNSRPVLNLLGGNPDLAEVAAMGLLEDLRANPMDYTSYNSDNGPSKLTILRNMLETGNKDKLEPLSQLFVDQKWLVNTLAAFPIQTDYSKLTKKQQALVKALICVVSTCLLAIPFLSYFEKLLRSALFLDLKRKYHLAAVLLCETNFIDLVRSKFSETAGFQGVISILNIERDRLSEKPMLKFPAERREVQPTAAASESTMSDADAHSLMDMFPQFNLGQAKTLLQQHVTLEGAMEYVLNNPHLLDDPSSVQEFQASSSSVDIDDDYSMPTTVQPPMKKYIFGKKEMTVSLNPDEDAKSANLQHALRMIYESDEDERDDTYEGMEGNDEETSQANAKLDKVQQFLFQLYMSDKQVFEKASRKTKGRAELKKTTEWSDEQIEGWARMLERNPRQFKMLETKMLEGGAKVKAVEEPKGDAKGKEKEVPDPEKQKQKQARDRRHKTQSKSSTHHRKSAHDRKMGKANYAE